LSRRRFVKETFRADPDLAFLTNADPDLDPLLDLDQGFKVGEFCSELKFFMFSSNKVAFQLFFKNLFVLNMLLITRLTFRDELSV
jgi:hypothetical protein